MYHIVICIQCVSIVVLLVESWVVFRNWKNRLHSWLFLGCASTLVNSTGYLFELLSRTEGEYFTALVLSYLGRVWIVFSLCMFIAELVHKMVPEAIGCVLGLLNFATFIFVCTTRSTGLYYRDISFSMIGDFPNFAHRNGIVHNVWNVLLFIMIAYCLSALFVTFLREKNRAAKTRYLLVLISMVTEASLLFIEMLDLVPLTEVYDVTMLGFPIGAIFMLIAIVKYQLMDTEMLARDYVNDELSEGVIAVDKKDVVRFYNKAALALFPGLAKDPRKVVDEVRGAIGRNEPITIGERIYTPKENVLKYEGDSAGTLYAFFDDTEHFRYTEELEKQKAIADAANKAKSSFLANMSHEIRTPINAILGMDEMILRESGEDNTLSYATDIETAGRTLLSLINDILDFSKIEEGRMEILPVQYELASVINDLVNMIRERAEKKGLKLEVDVDSEVPHLLYGDEIRIKQIVLNILTNAVKYTEKGEVRFEVGFSPCSGDEIMLRFRVSDTGIGMKEEDMEKLFSPFSRIEEERNRSIEGTGLGMSIVRQLLALMDSQLEVQSVYGEGSSFSFEIKQKVMSHEPVGGVVGRFKSGSKPRRGYRELFHAPDARMLAVDDTEVNLTVITNLLKKTQIRIDTASSGMEAIELAKENRYDLALIDHMMPEMDGIETMKRMRELPDGPAVYIALTANAVSGAREMYMNAGFSDYLSKPVDGRRLEETLKKYLPEEKVLKPEDGEKNGSGADPAGSGENSAASSAAAEEVFADPEEEPEIPEWVKDIPELDADSGVANCGSMESFINVLTVFHQTAAQKADEIEQLYNEGNIPDYTIKVHALKSSARIIGAARLSELAKELEAAGKEGNEALINEKTGELLADYRALDGRLVPLDDDRGDLMDLTPEMRREAFQTICEIADSMDFGLAEGMLKDLRGYRLSSADEEALKKIEGLLMQLDWDGIKEIAGGMQG